MNLRKKYQRKRNALLSDIDSGNERNVPSKTKIKRITKKKKTKSKR